MDLKETDILGKDISNHWYYRSKAIAIMRLIQDYKTPSSILDIGAGSGFFSKYLLSHTPASEAWCVDISYMHNSKSTDNLGKPIYFCRSLDSCNADLVLMMDVLEHVDDDVGLLIDYMHKVPYGARFLISVPAFKFLWSAHDEFLEHKRRYTLKELEIVVRKAGLTIDKSLYYYSLVFPIVLVTRIFGRLFESRKTVKSQLKKHHPIVNKILGWVCATELSFFKANQIAGLTIFCIARRL